MRTEPTKLEGPTRSPTYDSAKAAGLLLNHYKPAPGAAGNPNVTAIFQAILQALPERYEDYLRLAAVPTNGGNGNGQEGA